MSDVNSARNSETSSQLVCDLPAYLGRIGYEGELLPTHAVLEALHLAHATHIPFENLDVLLQRPILLDLESLQRKLVRERRGGGCFEQNLLFAAVLERIGFRVQRLAARVRHRTQRVLPRTHMLLLVETESATWLADVGFGADTPLLPVPFGAGAVARQFAWSYRLVQEGAQWVLQAWREGRWADLYAFTLEPQEVVDYEMALYFSATHPASPFVHMLTAQLSSPQARWILRNREFIDDTGESRVARTLSSDAELLQVLAGTFGLRFAPGTQFDYRDPPAP